jgi:hypothetical protein
MIRMREVTRARLMATHGFAMLGLGLGLFYIRAMMTNLFYYVFGCAFALLLVAASLLLIAALDWLCAAGLGSRQIAKLRGLLLLSTAAAAISFVLILYPSSTIRMLSYLIAVYALLHGIGKFRLARYWKGTTREQVVMYVLGGIAFFFSALLVVVAPRDERDILAVVASYCVFMGFQMLLSMYYLQQQTLKAIGSTSGPTRAHA